MPFSKEETDKLQAAYGKVYLLEAKFEGVTYEVAVRRPRRAEYKAYRSAAFAPDKKEFAVETLLLDVLVSPSREEFDKMLDAFPAGTEVFGAKVVEMLGNNVEASAKKAGS
jgi:hypothetical protein